MWVEQARQRLERFHLVEGLDAKLASVGCRSCHADHGDRGRRFLREQRRVFDRTLVRTPIRQRRHIDESDAGILFEHALARHLGMIGGKTALGPADESEERKAANAELRERLMRIVRSGDKQA